MSTTPRVIVVTRTKDRPNFLVRAINSVQSQTYKDFIQVIINDAGDKDRVNDVIDNLPADYRNRIRVIHNKESRGMEAASNKAIRSEDSEYIAVHDDDDTWHSSFLERTVEHLEKTNSMGVVVRTDKIVERINNGKIEQLKKTQYLSDVKTINLYRQCIDNQMTPITFIYRRSVFEELDGYDESLPVLGDWDFGIRFLQKYDVEFLNPGFALANYHHRKPTGSTADSSFGEGQEKHRYWSNKLMNKYLRQELSEGRLGVGYIMSKLRYDRHDRAEMVRRVLPTTLVNKIKGRIQN